MGELQRFRAAVASPSVSSAPSRLGWCAALLQQRRPSHFSVYTTR